MNRLSSEAQVVLGIGAIVLSTDLWLNHPASTAEAARLAREAVNATGMDADELLDRLHAENDLLRRQLRQALVEQHRKVSEYLARYPEVPVDDETQESGAG